MITITYEHNNSGGMLWIFDDQWNKLKNAGWVLSDDGREAEKKFKTREDAIAEFEKLTGIDVEKDNESGCPCCGQPHYFILGD